MAEDLVIPIGNEEELIAMAAKLGYDKLYLGYSVFNTTDFSEIGKKYNILVEKILFTSKKTLNKDAKLGIPLIIKANAEDRWAFEDKRIAFIYGVEESMKQDSMHYRRSGLNQVLCKLAFENKIQLCVSFESLLLHSHLRRVQLLGRVASNIRLCKKYGVTYSMYSFAQHPLQMIGKYEQDSFMRVL